jgi:hypothetical protein
MPTTSTPTPPFHIPPVLATKIAVIASAILLTFLAHTILQHQYYRQCKSNMFKVLFVQESDMCRGMQQAIWTLEGTYLSGSRYMTSNVFGPFMAVLMRAAHAGGGA